MRKTILATLLLSAFYTNAQDQRGSLGLGLFKACPQNGLEAINYDDGWGFKLTYLSRDIGLGDAWNLQFGAHMDISSMDSREFEPVTLNTPVADLGNLKVKNSMLGLFGVARLSYGQGSVRPFVEGLIGERSFNTKQIITAQSPGLNPEYESQTIFDQVVYTDRFHYGGSIGVSYQMNRSIIFETSITYTEGTVGAVMPLQDIYQQGQVLRYPHKLSETDMLLINAGIRFQFYKRTYTPRPPSYPSSTPTKTKTIDRTEDSNPPPPPPPPKTPKKKLEVKPDTKPKKIDTKDA